MSYFGRSNSFFLFLPETRVMGLSGSGWYIMPIDLGGNGISGHEVAEKQGECLNELWCR